MAGETGSLADAGSGGVAVAGPDPRGLAWTCTTAPGAAKMAAGAAQSISAAAVVRISLRMIFSFHAPSFRGTVF
jgi:hypothetical protein